MKLKVSRRKDVTKTRVEMSEIETKEKKEKINETNNSFLEKVNLTNLG